MTIISQMLSEPTEPGWYIARMKSWEVGVGFSPVRVMWRGGSADSLEVWQCADLRPWPVDAWEWRARIYP